MFEDKVLRVVLIPEYDVNAVGTWRHCEDISQSCRPHNIVWHYTPGRWGELYM